ncbi:hypothetical protein [Haloarcula sp. 1CSR25-25]|uniref:hypothetical protein n=1 Tax=Haloarcula sp. 1CSR25-25 TaxID=2862545 RepID=UPI00289488F6|nr:hypothetical protein [Haloarcula sp. 1CSR25-25]MDT3437274.1 hypothetical protein [Haloarcula sp. 1CSR25-25]
MQDGAANQAGTQGVVGQVLAWTSEPDGVDDTGIAQTVLGYLVDDLWDEAAGTFASGPDDSAATITARDAGDVTGGINAADAVLGLEVKDTYARWFNRTTPAG